MCVIARSDKLRLRQEGNEHYREHAGDNWSGVGIVDMDWLDLIISTAIKTALTEVLRRILARFRLRPKR